MIKNWSRSHLVAFAINLTVLFVVVTYFLRQYIILIFSRVEKYGGNKYRYVYDHKYNNTLINRDSTHSRSNLNKRQLEFVHITKTGGSAIEQAAAISGIKWGCCHWKNVKSFGETCKRDKIFPSYNWDNIPIQFKGILGEPWHTPNHWFDPDPYANSSTFTIIRNPYNRALSEYYCKFGGYHGEDRNNSTIMNRWLMKQMKRMNQSKYRAHFLPQHYYVYDKKGAVLVDHVLRYETLETDFEDLMYLYDLNNVDLPERINTRSDTSSLTIANLKKRTIYMINDVFADDFYKLNYSKIK